MATAKISLEQLTEWGSWINELSARSDVELEAYDIAALNLRCLAGLVDDLDELIPVCLDKLAEWSPDMPPPGLISRFTNGLLEVFDWRNWYRRMR